MALTSSPDSSVLEGKARIFVEKYDMYLVDMLVAVRVRERSWWEEQQREESRGGQGEADADSASCCVVKVAACFVPLCVLFLFGPFY
jgi:hypothetical protein